MGDMLGGGGQLPSLITGIFIVVVFLAFLVSLLQLLELI